MMNYILQKGNGMWEGPVEMAHSLFLRFISDYHTF